MKKFAFIFSIIFVYSLFVDISSAQSKKGSRTSKKKGKSSKKRKTAKGKKPRKKGSSKKKKGAKGRAARSVLQASVAPVVHEEPKKTVEPTRLPTMPTKMVQQEEAQKMVQEEARKKQIEQEEQRKVQEEARRREEETRIKREEEIRTLEAQRKEEEAQRRDLEKAQRAAREETKRKLEEGARIIGEQEARRREEKTTRIEREKMEAKRKKEEDDRKLEQEEAQRKLKEGVGVKREEEVARMKKKFTYFINFVLEGVATTSKTRLLEVQSAKKNDIEVMLAFLCPNDNANPVIKSGTPGFLDFIKKTPPELEEIKKHTFSTVIIAECIKLARQVMQGVYAQNQYFKIQNIDQIFEYLGTSADGKRENRGIFDITKDKNFASVWLPRIQTIINITSNTKKLMDDFKKSQEGERSFFAEHIFTPRENLQKILSATERFCDDPKLMEYDQVNTQLRLLKTAFLAVISNFFIEIIVPDSLSKLVLKEKEKIFFDQKSKEIKNSLRELYGLTLNSEISMTLMSDSLPLAVNNLITSIENIPMDYANLDEADRTYPIS